MQTRVVVTGLGAVSPIGLTAETSWQNALKGVSGVGPITLFDASDLLVQIACEVKDFNPEDTLPAKEARRRDRFEQFAASSVKQAVDQSGLNSEKVDPTRVGVILSSAIGGLHTLEDVVLTRFQDGARRISPFAIPMLMSNGAAGMAAIDYGFHGPCFSVASACASGLDAIGLAWMLIRTGVIDAALAGASETTMTPVGVGAFDRLGAMSRRNEPVSGSYPTPQPFDLNRDGLVMGEGAAVLVVESESHARARGAEILAELAGYAATADAFHVTAPEEQGKGSGRAMQLALESAGVNVDEVSYINAHGTATLKNDLSETRAIKATFGKIAYNIPVSSTKSMTGHMMGATGALESVFCVNAIRTGVIPPTINYHTPDPDCDLDYVPNQAREVPVNVAMNNAFGFGGHNAVLVFRRYSG